LRQHRVLAPDRRVRGEVAVAHARADPETAARQRLNPVERQPRHVDEQVRFDHAELHVVDQIRSATQESGLRAGGDGRHRARHVFGATVVEGDHHARPSPASPIVISLMAAMMYG
jgi:hypothetical protein